MTIFNNYLLKNRLHTITSKAYKFLDNKRMDEIMGNFAYLLADLIMGIADLISMLLFVYIIISLLVSFNVINAYNQFVSIVYGTLRKLFEPVLGPIRNALPDLGGIDFSPIILFLILKYGMPFIAEAIIRLA